MHRYTFINSKYYANGLCTLDPNSLVPVLNIPSLSESSVTGLSSDLNACEKTALKNESGGYPLDSNTSVAAVNIPS